MRVLLINNFHYRKGGSEAVYFNTADLLKANGHEVIFFAFSDDAIDCDQKEFFDHRGNKLKQVRDFFWNPDAAKKLEALIMKERPDVAHVHLFWGGLSPSIFGVLKKYDIPLVHSVHDYRMVCPAYTFKDGKGNECERCKRWNYYECALHKCSKGSFVQSVLMSAEMYLRQLFHNPLDNIAGFIFVSNFAKKKHVQHHREFEYSKNIVLYNYTNPCLQRSIDGKKDYMLYYGRLSFEKGIPTLMEAIKRFPSTKLKVVGTGPLENELKTKYAEYTNVEFMGYRSGNELFELVRDARFVLVPSEWYENNPMTIIEAYSLGTPVIGAEIGGIPEIVDEGKTGFCFESRNVESLVNVIARAVCLSHEQYQALCDGAYEFYKKKFSADCHYERLIEFYKQVLRK